MAGKPRLFVEVGQRIGRSTVLVAEVRFPGRHSRRVKLLCDCGNEYEAQIARLVGKQAKTKSCGCLQKEYTASSDKKGRLLPPGIAARNMILCQYKSEAKQRERLWNLTEEEFDQLTASKCFYCGRMPSTVRRTPGGEFIYNGIDRVDNNLGYISENVVSACQICNLAKRDMSFDNFMTWINDLVIFRASFSNERMPA